MSSSGTPPPSWRGEFSQQVYHVLAAVPAGRLVTYGQIAERIPAPPGMDPLAFKRIRARWVGYVLAGCPDDVPWHRVVNSQGKVSSRHGHGPHVQPVLLEEEGVHASPDGTYNLASYGWNLEANRPTGESSTEPMEQR